MATSDAFARRAAAAASVPPSYCTSACGALALIAFSGEERCQITRAKNPVLAGCGTDRKSTRLNSSHLGISYAVFCLRNNVDLMQVDGRGGHMSRGAGDWCHSAVGVRVLSQSRCAGVVVPVLCGVFVWALFFLNDGGAPGVPPSPAPAPSRN